MNIKLANERKAKHYSEGVTLFYREIKLQYSGHSATGWPLLCLLTVLYPETLHQYT